jgi:hypothetical protein
MPRAAPRSSQRHSRLPAHPTAAHRPPPQRAQALGRSGTFDNLLAARRGQAEALLSEQPRLDRPARAVDRQARAGGAALPGLGLLLHARECSGPAGYWTSHERDRTGGVVDVRGERADALIVRMTTYGDLDQGRAAAEQLAAELK